MKEFKVRPLSDLMGAEILGIDLRQKNRQRYNRHIIKCY
jgi:hypothetical protein